MAGKHVIEALSLHKKGFNCAQSVALPFCAELGIDKQTVMKATEGFGAGMGGYNLTCGALSGAIFVAGSILSDGNLEHPASKRNTYAVCKEISEAFEKECGSTSCYDIRGVESKCPLKSCNECIMIAASLAEKVLNKK